MTPRQTTKLSSSTSKGRTTRMRMKRRKGKGNQRTNHVGVVDSNKEVGKVPLTEKICIVHLAPNFDVRM